MHLDMHLATMHCAIEMELFSVHVQGRQERPPPALPTSVVFHGYARGQLPNQLHAQQPKTRTRTRMTEPGRVAEREADGTCVRLQLLLHLLGVESEGKVSESISAAEQEAVHLRFKLLG